MSDNNLRIDIIPRDLYYHEVAYVRGLEKRIGALEAALQFIADGYDNQDVNHVDYRVRVYQVARAALEKDASE